MSLQRIFFMGIVLAVVLGFIFVVDRPDRERQSRAEFLLEQEPIEGFSQITIARGGETFSALNTAPKADAAALADKPSAPLADGWKLEGVEDSALDSVAFSGLLTSLEQAKPSSIIPEADLGSDLGIFGLSAPALVLTISRPNLPPRVIRFGKKNEYVNERYVSFSSGDEAPKVGLIPETLYAAANKPRSDFRDKHPLKFSDFDVAKLSLDWGAEKIALTNDLGWKLTAPVAATGSASAISGLLREIREFTVDEFIDAAADKKQFGLDQPGVRISMEFKDSKRAPVEILIAKGPVRNEVEGAYFLVSGRSAIFSMHSNPIQTLKRSVNELRDRKLFHFEVDNAVKVDARSEAVSMLMERKGAVWSVNGGDADPLFAREYLLNLSQVEAASFPTVGETGDFSHPLLTVTITMEGDNSPRSLIIGAKKELQDGQPVYFASTGDGGEVFFIVEDTLRRIMPKADALKKYTNTPAPLLSPSPAPE